jgi:molybdate transport system substrate-binding protein
LTVAAASNLTGVFDQAAAAFTAQTGIEVVLSYGSTAQLARQIENGAPFDLFAAADTEHIDQLIAAGKLLADSRAIYARGQLALWVPKGELSSLDDLTRPEIRMIAIAQPELAPYGQAAVEAMRTAGLWDRLQPKLVFANNIGMARQFAATGNAEAAFTAYSLVMQEPGTILKVDPKLHAPLDQALGILTASTQQEPARAFAAFLASKEGKTILRNSGYIAP